MSKLYFLVPDISVAEEIVAALRSAGLSDKDIGLIAHLRARPAGDGGGLLSAGGETRPSNASLAGLDAASTPSGLCLAGAAVGAMTLAQAPFGAWLSGMVGASVPNDDVAEIVTALQSGALLAVVHTARLDREKVKRRIADRYPQVAFDSAVGMAIPIA